MSLFDFLGKDPRSRFLEFTPQDSHWQVVSWNYDLKDPSHRMWTLEVLKEAKSESIQWIKAANQEVRFFRNGRLTRKRRITPHQNEYKDLMNLAVHSTLKYGLESHHEFLLEPVSGATAMDFQNEAKALLWIQASFGTLMRALDQFDGRSDLILTAAVFSGKEPDTEEDVLRVIAFNLDIFYYFQKDQSLRVLIFDDKDLGPGQAKGPAFQQIIKVTKPQIYDEIVKLVHRIATVGEVR